MATILTTREQKQAGEAARRVGGYSELIRLETERRQAKGKGTVVRDASNGRYSFAPSSAAPKN